LKRRTLQVDEAGAGRTLGDTLAHALGATPPRAGSLVSAGAAYVDGRRCLDAARVLRAGQKVVVVLEEGGTAADAPLPPRPALSVLFEDEALLVVDKPAGIAAQPTLSRRGDSLLDAVEAYLGRPGGLVHRLDRETSGVTVFGKSPEAIAALAAEFREGRAQKRYLAATAPLAQAEGEIGLRLSKDPSRPGRYRASRTANGVTAHTRYRRLWGSEAFALVELLPTTGRTHQLRAHLRALDAPILGDVLYGGARAADGLDAPRCLLHAQGLALRAPRGEARRFEAPVPEDLGRFFARAAIDPPTGAWE
jgi:23S rRNA pseudouridine1911/1915/1917 synthase